ncbi:sentrin-specific protease 2-like isoform X1 [Melanerpes formicivorus]|uniref:sentrin-specific protease 2-like isoform X1 n=1 Tax=Melanerpes formicivorus TaxID=211600 RepID=UPI00358E7FF2
MYQWLLGTLSALLAAARRPTTSPAPPPRKRPLPSIQPPLEDEEEVPSKRQKSGDVIAVSKEKVPSLSAVVKLPAKTARKHNATRTAESAEESQATTSDLSSKRPTGSALEVEMLQLDKMPCGTNTCLNRETLPLSHKTVPHLSMGRNGKHFIKPVPDVSLTLRPPIKERAVPESTTPEAIKMGRFYCTAEEDVQRGEKEKYKQLLQLVKENYAGIHPPPQLTGFCSVQDFSKEPVMAEGHLKERKYGDIYPYMTLKTSINCADACSPQRSQRSDMIRYYTPAENSHEQGRPVKAVTAGGQYGAERSEEALVQLHLAPVLSRKSAGLEAEETKFPRLEKPAELLSVLTEALEREVHAAFGRGEPDEVLSSAFKLKVTREDIGTLREHRWLNDEVINFYMRLIAERSKKEGFAAVHAFSTFFYPKLISGGYTAVRRWTRGVDLFQQDLIFVPIHLRVHWALVVIDVRRKTIKYYDSMGQKGDKICQTLFQYLREESHEKRNLELASSEWTLRSMESHEIPQQSNGSDCGVFVCKYAEYISRDRATTFTQKHMPYFRKRMVWEIIHQQLL